MAALYWLGLRVAVALTLVACFTVLPAAAAPVKDRERTSTVAGWVDVKAEVAPYVVLRVVDDSTGMVVRSAPLDATHTFSFAGIAPTTISVEAVASLPDHLFALDAAASVLKAPVSADSSIATVQLKVAAAPRVVATVAESSAATAGSSVVPAVLALAALLAAWYGRHRIVSSLELPTFKPPKQRKMMVAM